MRFLLDANIVIHALEDLRSVHEKLVEHAGSVTISALCAAEVRRGLHKDPDRTMERRQKLRILLSQIPTRAFDDAAVDAYDQVIGHCGFVRSRDFDRMIAAHAISLNAVFVTGNEADFSDVPGLVVENWTVP